LSPAEDALKTSDDVIKKLLPALRQFVELYFTPEVVSVAHLVSGVDGRD